MLTCVGSGYLFHKFSRTARCWRWHRWCSIRWFPASCECAWNCCCCWDGVWENGGMEQSFFNKCCLFRNFGLLWSFLLDCRCVWSFADDIPRWYIRLAKPLPECLSNLVRNLHYRAAVCDPTVAAYISIGLGITDVFSFIPVFKTPILQTRSVRPHPFVIA